MLEIPFGMGVVDGMTRCSRTGWIVWVPTRHAVMLDRFLTHVTTEPRTASPFDVQDSYHRASLDNKYPTQIEAPLLKKGLLGGKMPMLTTFLLFNLQRLTF